MRLGLDLGLSLIETAEMYADGGAEKLVGEAIAGRRVEVFLVSKVLPQHATRRETIVACERSLRRLGRDRLDLYLLPWCRQRGLPIMVYSPIEQGQLSRHTVLEAVAAGHCGDAGAGGAGLGRAPTRHHRYPQGRHARSRCRESAALDLHLTDEDLAWLELAFPPPDEPQPLEII